VSSKYGGKRWRYNGGAITVFGAITFFQGPNGTGKYLQLQGGRRRGQCFTVKNIFLEMNCDYKNMIFEA